MCIIHILFRALFRCVRYILYKILSCLFSPLSLLSYLFTRKCFSKPCGFLGGFLLGTLYYYCLLTKIPFPPYVHYCLMMTIGLLLGIGNTMCRQLRCICLLTIPMYCGKPGRGVLKALVLTYVIAGPIKNMCLNAREVVRVFACSTQLSANLTKSKYYMLSEPFKQAIVDLDVDILELVDTFRSFQEVTLPIEQEILADQEIHLSRDFNQGVDYILSVNRSGNIDAKYEIKKKDDIEKIYQKKYLRKLEYRCEAILSRAITSCVQTFQEGYEQCTNRVPRFASWFLCWPMKITRICNFLNHMEPDVCDVNCRIDSGLGEGFLTLEKVKREMKRDVKLKGRLNKTQQVEDIQDAKETGERVMHAFEEKDIVMRTVIHIVNILVALLFLRIIIAAGSYHDTYLTRIEFDNVYITGYFKLIDERRRNKEQLTLLPLKKMERRKYIDVHSLAYNVDCDKLLVQILKVLLEMITATTFVMLDRLFFEALDVVRQHAEMDVAEDAHHDMQVEVKGTGLLAKIIRNVIEGVKKQPRYRNAVTNRQCLPAPSLMPPVFFLKIYGGYLWIQLLLYMNPYTMRLSRLICSWYYRRREKQRILHLYNDILKKRMKMQKTLRKKAVQVVRAYYLSGENLLSLRMKFPQLLGWLKIFPAARMSCPVCGETEPRNPPNKGKKKWHMCYSAKCPFIYCTECWNYIDQRCLACDPGLAELSDVDSFSDEVHPRY
ncbi:E3 ubiquitin-protein ligase DCST1 [Hyposmocoma kahamanoa]|uniref:E3 ubiquitin-protein ligase DCST1 n=1 Tax=Hyposmocoma kahamanoa TaxID=1477025 RepID=UPI000E6D667E|nr:E3 ubiquitin-protein ligase DCST1 [Hyposmocoma kahamanoa]